jgi:hypothetical protein
MVEARMPEGTSSAQLLDEDEQLPVADAEGSAGTALVEES